MRDPDDDQNTGRTAGLSPAATFIVCVLVGISVLLWSLLIAEPGVGQEMLRRMQFDPYESRQGFAHWNMFAASYVHSNALHLGLNLVLVCWLAPPVERVLGSTRFLVFFALAGTFGYAIYDLSTGFLPYFGPTLGASGAVFALATLFALCFPEREVTLYGGISLSFRWLLSLFVLSDLLALAVPDGLLSVNHTVHLGGVAFGFLYWLSVIQRKGAP